MQAASLSAELPLWVPVIFLPTVYKDHSMSYGSNSSAGNKCVLGLGLGTKSTEPNIFKYRVVYPLQDLQEPVPESKKSYYNCMLYQHFVCLQGK